MGLGATAVAPHGAGQLPAANAHPHAGSVHLVTDNAGRERVARYVDGFVIPVPKRNVQMYRRMAQKAGKVWIEHGALEFRECIGDDLKVKGMTPFPRVARARRGDTVFFSWIVYKSRAHRDRVNAKVMKDPRIANMTDEKAMPFDTKRMVYGGFKVLVDL
jgi:uncharacterized protein YbaA (DUF1428 family)